MLFTFKKAAVALLGSLEGHGLLVGITLAGAEVFVMPGPMEATPTVDRALGALREWWGSGTVRP
ncbi:MAG: hypothetical protein JWQ48_2937 [Conexibacter sp.]|nr:hypothetical protein [Conexibacter sp.]